MTRKSSENLMQVVREILNLARGKYSIVLAYAPPFRLIAIGEKAISIVPEVSNGAVANRFFGGKASRRFHDSNQPQCRRRRRPTVVVVRCLIEVGASRVGWGPPHPGPRRGWGGPVSTTA